VENVCGITSRFRILHARINLNLDTIVVTYCVLRNYSCLHRRCTSFGQKESNMEEFEGDENVLNRYRMDLADMVIREE
jgi:hypothetical protein